MKRLVAPMDLGHEVEIEHFTYANDDDELPVGFIENHARPDNGERCFGAVRFDTPEAHDAYKLPGPFWQVVSWEPLHIEPSVLCRICGHHGFIREGKWVPA